MSAGHTPGPWKVFHTRDGRKILGVGDRDGGGITDHGDVSTNDQGVWRSGQEKEANARLTAAAPDLVEALQEMCAAAEYWAGCDEDCTPDAASSEIMSSGGAWPAQAYDQARAALSKALTTNPTGEVK